MKLRSGRRKAAESPVRKVKLRMPLKKSKESAAARLNGRSVQSYGLVEKNDECERNQSEDPAPAPSTSGPSRPGCSRKNVSTMSVSDMEIGPGYGSTPLLEEVLENILGFLTFAEVKSARLVNKHWRQVATTLLRRSSKQIEVERSVSECITKMGDGQFPVNRLEVVISDFFDTEQTKISSACLPGISAWVKELTLTVFIYNLPGVRVQDETTAVPTDCVYKNLTHFTLKLYQYKDVCRESWERFTDIVRIMLEKSPNLREVNIGYENWIAGAKSVEICPLIENLFPISNSVGVSKLSYINLESVPIEKIDLAKWPTLNLKLKKLGVNVSCFSNTNDLLTNFLETQTETLKELTLNQSRRDSKAPAATFTFPRLEKLEQLRVICDYIYAPVTFTDVDYARLFPCLKKLDLKQNRGNWRDFLGNDLLEPTKTLEELIFPVTVATLNGVDLTPNPAVTAAKVFTGLKKLEIGTDPDLIQAVYENMPNLEVLTVSKRPFETYDDVITGLGSDVCMKFKGVMTKRWIQRLQNAEGRSMARLQKLKTLKLMYCGVKDHLRFSRLSLHVFNKMRSLERLDLLHGRNISISTALRCSTDEDQKQFLEDLRANFVLL